MKTKNKIKTKWRPYYECEQYKKGVQINSFNYKYIYE
jgi:hypothetical protein